MNWKAECNPATISMKRGNVRIDEVPVPSHGVKMFIYDNGTQKSHISGAMITELANEIRLVMESKNLRAVEGDDEGSMLLVMQVVGMPVAAVILKTPAEDIGLSLRTSYSVPMHEIGQALADIALYADTERDMEGVIKEALRAAIEIGERIVSTFDVLEEIHDASAQPT